MPAMEGRTFAHPDQPMAGRSAGWIRRSCGSGVNHLHLERHCPILNPNACRRSSRMLPSVGEGFLDHPIGGHLEGRREELRFSLNRQIDSQFCSAYLSDEVGELREAGLGCEFVDVTGAP